MRVELLSASQQRHSDVETYGLGLEGRDDILVMHMNDVMIDK